MEYWKVMGKVMESYGISKAQKSTNPVGPRVRSKPISSSEPVFFVSTKNADSG